ncbi:MAG TPA: DNA starvation/stationary phase protection protein [Alphaproteobacteria bacterium]|jgi:starvation-inducible DNA-binding protein|nr:DNA starvation/stationary phase protection protein [Alphaproteobacteria bacterium]
MTAQTLKKTDRLSVGIGVEEKKREKVAEELSGFLASTFMLYLKTHYYHWNVTGPNFIGLHELFDQQYNALLVAGDELAERVRALGHFTPGTVNEFIELSEIKDDGKLPASAEDMVRNLLKANEACSNQARAVLEVAEDAEDEVTVDLMVTRMTAHDKASWMLRSTLE